MRATMHVVATLMLLPYIALAAGFVLLGQVAAGKSLPSLFATLLAQALWLMPWGLIGLAAVICVVAALGFSVRLRWLGGCCLCAIAAACLIVIIVTPTAPMSSGQLLFVAPCGLVLLFGAWLGLAERRVRS
jgi:hypothetical protein